MIEVKARGDRQRSRIEEQTGAQDKDRDEESGRSKWQSNRRRNKAVGMRKRFDVLKEREEEGKGKDVGAASIATLFYTHHFSRY